MILTMLLLYYLIVSYIPGQQTKKKKEISNTSYVAKVIVFIINFLIMFLLNGGMIFHSISYIILIYNVNLYLF
jgi:hypothetical protein